MKKSFTLFLIFILFSCGSNNRIIENYLLEEMKKNEKENNILIKEKISFENSMLCFMPLTTKPHSIEKLKLYEDLNKKYGGKLQENWREKDFKKINFNIIPEDSLSNYKKNNELKFSISNLYFISKPFFYKGNKDRFVFFNINLCKNSYRCTGDNFYGIILKKVKGKWIFVEKRPTSNLY